MKITIETIDHNKQRYNTVGDWQFNRNGDLKIYVSETKNDYRNFLIGIHELVEAVLCKIHGIDQLEVDKWDLNFKGYGEPGDDINCPYYYEHQLAAIVEILLCKESNFSWQEYSERVTQLVLTYRK